MNDEQKLHSPWMDVPARNVDRFAESDNIQAKLAAIGGGPGGSLQQPGANALGGVLDALQQRLQSTSPQSQPSARLDDPRSPQGFAGHFVSLATVAEKMHAAAGSGPDVHQRAANALEAMRDNGIKIRENVPEPKGEVTHNPAVH